MINTRRHARRLRRFAIVLVIAGMSSLVPDAAAESNAAPFTSSQASTWSACTLASSTPSLAECGPKLVMDARTGTIRANLSIRTPRNGLLPGWGETKGKGKIVAVRRLETATRGARFEIRVRRESLDHAARLLVGFGTGHMKLYGVAHHDSCSTCKGASVSQHIDVNESESATNEDHSFVVSLRNRDPEQSLVPAGKVRVALVFAGHYVIYPPSCCSLGSGTYLWPPLPHFQTPAIGEIQARLRATVLSISRVA